MLSFFEFQGQERYPALCCIFQASGDDERMYNQWLLSSDLDLFRKCRVFNLLVVLSKFSHFILNYLFNSENYVYLHIRTSVKLKRAFLQRFCLN